MKRVGARRRNRVVDQPHRLAELRRVAAGDDLDLADHHLRHRHLPQAGAILLRVVAAVHLVVDAKQRAIRGEARDAELVVLEADDARLQQREVVRVARGEWQRLDLALRSACGPAPIFARSTIGESATTVTVSATAPTVSVMLITAVEPATDRTPVCSNFLNPCSSAVDAIRAERQQRRAEETTFVGDDDALIAGVDVDDGDGDAGSTAPCVVDDRAFDRAVDGLDCAAADAAGATRTSARTRRAKVRNMGRLRFCVPAVSLAWSIHPLRLPPRRPVPSGSASRWILHCSELWG